MMRIAYLADHPQHVSTVAAWIYGEWGHAMPGETLEKAVAKFRSHMNRDSVPLTMIAFSEKGLLGTASLFVHDMDTHRDLSPWLAAVFVPPRYRGAGIGTQLVQAVEEVSRRLRLGRLYLFTPDREGFYARLEWSVLERAKYRGQSVAIMTKSLGSG